MLSALQKQQESKTDQSGATEEAASKDENLLLQNQI
jgi:hypothetical protein